MNAQRLTKENAIVALEKAVKVKIPQFIDGTPYTLRPCEEFAATQQAINEVADDIVIVECWQQTGLAKGNKKFYVIEGLEGRYYQYKDLRNALDIRAQREKRTNSKREEFDEAKFKLNWLSDPKNANRPVKAIERELETARAAFEENAKREKHAAKSLRLIEKMTLEERAALLAMLQEGK